MDYIFEEWQQVLNDYATKVKDDLAEIRKCKEEIQQLKTDIFNAVAKGYYRRDEERIVLSAPEIIIGDVDKEGNLWMNHEQSKVIIRSNNIRIEGVSSRIPEENNEAVGGSITCKAASIKNLAVDPGPYGNENVVHSNVSEIVTLGKAIKMSTIDTEGFIPDGETSATEGIKIHSGSRMSIDASVSNEKLGQTLATQKEKLGTIISDLNTALNAKKEIVNSDIKEIADFYKEAEKLGESVEDVRCNSARIMDIRNEIDMKLPVLYEDVTDYLTTVSDLANANREDACLDTEITRLNEEKATFKDIPTGATLSINAEKILMNTKDGDGNFKDKSLINCKSKYILVNSLDNDNKLVEGSKFSVNTETIILSANQKTKDVQNKKISETPVGRVALCGKQFDILADSYVYNSETQEFESKETVSDSLLTVDVETTLFDAFDGAGKSIGKFSVNSKDIIVSAIDKDEDANNVQLSEEGKLTVIANTMHIGSCDEMLSKEIGVATEAISVNGTQETMILQGGQEVKAFIDMSDGKINISGDEIDETGTLTIESETEFKAAVKGKEAEFTKVTAKSGLKGPNLEDK